MNTQFNIDALLRALFAVMVVTLCVIAYRKAPYPRLPKATLVRVIDGDTIVVNLKGTHPLFGHEVGVRINGIDTPELRTKNKCEKAKGLEAKAFVIKLLEHAKRIELRNPQRGKYFRIVADVFADGTEIGNALIANGLAYEYHGGTKLKIDWCK